MLDEVELIVEDRSFPITVLTSAISFTCHLKKIPMIEMTLTAQCICTRSVVALFGDSPPSSCRLYSVKAASQAPDVLFVRGPGLSIRRLDASSSSFGGDTTAWQ